MCRLPRQSHKAGQFFWQGTAGSNLLVWCKPHLCLNFHGPLKHVVCYYLQAHYKHIYIFLLRLKDKAKK